MNRPTIFMLALGVFFTATSELVVSGVLNVIAEDLNVSLALAGQLVTVYSLAFAIGTPILVSLTSRAGRKKVLLGSLFSFIVGCFISYGSANLAMLMISRAILGVSSGVFLVVVFAVTAKLVPAEKLGRAIGTVVLGFSSAMILGVPIGIAVSNWFEWQTIFILLGIFSLFIAYAIFRLVPEVEGDAPVPFLQQFKVLGSIAIVGGLLITLFRESGNSVMFTYLIPYMQSILHVHASMSSVIMLALGIFGMIGSRLGGYGVDRWGAARMIMISIIVQAAALALLPLLSSTTAVGLSLIALMVFTMFVAGPAVQSYFIQQAPRSSNLVLSLNTSIVHLGLAAGAGAGGLVVNSASTLAYHPWVAVTIVVLGLATAVISFTMRSTRSQTRGLQ